MFLMVLGDSVKESFDPRGVVTHRLRSAGPKFISVTSVEKWKERGMKSLL